MRLLKVIILPLCSFLFLQLSTDLGLNVESFGSRTHLGWGYYPYRMSADRIMFANVDFNVTDADQGSVTYYETTDSQSEIAGIASDEIERFLGKDFIANHVFVINYDDVETAKGLWQTTTKVIWIFQNCTPMFQFENLNFFNDTLKMKLTIFHFFKQCS